MLSPENPASFPPPVTNTDTIPEISVIVGTIDAARSVHDCLRSVQTSLTGMDAELIVADASNDDTAALIERYFPRVILIRMPPGTLTPRLWTAGLAQAHGRHIAFMTGHSTVPPHWSRALSAALGGSVAGAGGPLALSANSSLTDAAIYFLRYSAFMPSSDDTTYPAIEIAGDNAMYRGDLLRKHMASFADGFWEVPFHHILRGEGQTLMMVPAAEIEFGRSFSLGAISSQRFAHGRHFGKWRTTTGGTGKTRIIAGSPIVPFILLARITRRVIRSCARPKNAVAARPGSAVRNPSIARFVASSPLMLWLGVCWAIGEALGAWES